MAETRTDAEKAFDFFVDAYGAKYHKAVERLTKDRERLLTVRLRTVKTKGCLSRMTALAMVFKVILSAKRKWRKLDGSNQFAEIIEGVQFKDGKRQTQCAA